MDSERLKQDIMRIKKERDVAVLAHTYQDPDIIDVADVTGDSFALSVAAQALPQKAVVMCGVRFMADTIKILSPDKLVTLAERHATCPMAEQIAPKRVAAFKKENPDVAVVAYINTTTELKAECDVCVTSSSAVKIVSQLSQKKILFLPDQNLGQYVAQQLPDKEILLWDGCCPVHAQISGEDVAACKAQYPDAPVLMHPECRPEAAKQADFLGSTAAIIKQALALPDRQVIIATERGVADYLNREHPDREFIQLCPEKLTCPNMKRTRLVHVLASVEGVGGDDIYIEEPLRLRAKKPIDEMIRLGG